VSIFPCGASALLPGWREGWSGAWLAGGLGTGRVGGLIHHSWRWPAGAPAFLCSEAAALGPGNLLFFCDEQARILPFSVPAAMAFMKMPPPTRPRPPGPSSSVGGWRGQPQQSRVPRPPSSADGSRSRSHGAGRRQLSWMWMVRASPPQACRVRLAHASHTAVLGSLACCHGRSRQPACRGGRWGSSAQLRLAPAGRSQLRATHIHCACQGWHWHSLVVWVRT
jgi:hypothetical protein